MTVPVDCTGMVLVFWNRKGSEYRGVCTPGKWSGLTGYDEENAGPEAPTLARAREWSDARHLVWVEHYAAPNVTFFGRYCRGRQDLRNFLVGMYDETEGALFEPGLFSPEYLYLIGEAAATT